jgi:hypothetical protein
MTQAELAVCLCGWVGGKQAPWGCCCRRGIQAAASPSKAHHLESHTHHHPSFPGPAC